jgi:signal transduction histidine kinase
MKIGSLRFKINAAILLTFTIIALCSAAILYPFEINRRQSRLEKINILMSTVYQQKKEELANEIFSDQKIALDSSLNDMLRVKGMALLNVYDLEGNLLTSTDDTEKAIITHTEQKSLNASPTFSRVTREGKPLAEYATVIEIIGERVGYLKMYFDLEEMERESLLTILFLFTFLTATLLIMSVLLNILLSRSVIRPASVLRNAIGKVRAGRLGERVRLTTRDEIGEIATDFNEMSTRLHEQHLALMNAIETKDSFARQLQETNQQLEELNTRLEDMVNERTAELQLSYEQLQEEIKEREKADREKKLLREKLARSQKMEALGLLAGGVAHDLNNVLSGIVSYPDLLLMDMPEDSPLRKPILTIKDSGQKAAAIVQDLLTLARRGVMNTEVLNLNQDIVMDYLKSPEHEKMQAFHRGIRIETRLEPALLNIRGSSVHLKKTLMNLLSNAIEAQPQGGAVVISTENRYVDQPIEGFDDVQEGDYVVLRIEDRGLGIAPEDMGRIFEPFYTKKIMGRSGTGLGMAVVWGTVQDHRGFINIESEEGVGTVFEIFFPVTRDVREKERTVIPFKEYKGHGQNVLVVDDVKEQREIATNILTKLGYAVATVSSGEEAVEYMQRHDADIIILDMIMDPGMDGLDTYKKIITMHPRQKAVIASGFAESERVKEAQKLGAGQYIKKPYTMEKMGLALKTELQQ